MLQLIVVIVKAIAQHHKHFSSTVSTRKYLERMDDEKRTDDRGRVRSVTATGTAEVHVCFQLVHITTLVTYTNYSLTLQ